MTCAYLDSSALVKLVIEEEESRALAHDLTHVDVVVTSIIGRVELERAVRRRHHAAFLDSIEQVLAGVVLIPLDVAIAAVASRIVPEGLRTLDAIHIATATAVSDDLDCCYCYDQRLSDGLTQRGFKVVAPA